MSGGSTARQTLAGLTSQVLAAPELLEAVDQNDIALAKAGAAADGETDDTPAFAAVRSTYGRRKILADGNYAVKDLYLGDTPIEGGGTLKALPGSSFILGVSNNSLNGWRYGLVSGLYLNGVDRTRGDGIDLNRAGSDDRLAGRRDFERLLIENCDVGIRKRFGNIGNNFRSVSTKYCNYGYRAEDKPLPNEMHAGCDTFQGGEWARSYKAAFLIDSELTGTGQTSWLPGTVIESNYGFGIFVRNYASSVVPVLIDHVWFEGNASFATVDIDGVICVPRDIRLDNTAYAIIRGSIMRKVEFNNSSVLLDGVFVDDQTEFTIGATNRLRVINLNTDGFKGVPGLAVESLVHCKRPAGTYSDAYQTAPRTKLIKRPTNNGTSLISQTFDGTSGITLGGDPGNLISTQVDDSVLFEKCSEFTQPDGYVNVGTQASLTSGKWYCYRFDYLQVSGMPTSLRLQANTTLARDFENLIVTGEWVPMGGVARAVDTNTVGLRIGNGSGASHTFRVSALDVVEFDAEAQAIAYFNLHVSVQG